MTLHHLNIPFETIEQTWICQCYCGYKTKPQRTRDLALRHASRHVQDKELARR